VIVRRKISEMSLDELRQLEERLAGIEYTNVAPERGNRTSAAPNPGCGKRQNFPLTFKGVFSPAPFAKSLSD